MRETIRRAGTRRQDTARATLQEVLTQVLKWAGLVLLVAASAVLVYLGAVLAARLAVWFFFI
ncbi:MAG TPA: hypothetical protein VEZ19_06315 [Rubrobacter sp.]|nr:hypothetical protein [Rubrobacter sp.]